ncbi:MAG: hypothetical protein VB084_12780 [Syntrophomonadaceae bacterium]|nr:hypothetical protein [Syntrophomonadaceae bacterium]
MVIEDDVSEPLGTLFNIMAGESVEAPVNLSDTLTFTSETLSIMLQQFSPPIVRIELPSEPPYPAAQATLGNMSGATVAYEEALLFNTPDMSAGTITFDQNTGIFTLNETGMYKISWWVATNIVQSGSYVSFAVRFNGQFIIGQTFAATPTGQVNGDLVYWFFETGTTLELINNTIDTDVTLVTTPYQASMSVVRRGGLGF